MFVPHRYIKCQHAIFTELQFIKFYLSIYNLGYYGFGLSDIQLLDRLEHKIFVLSLAYLGNAHLQIILSLA